MSAIETDEKKKEEENNRRNQLRRKEKQKRRKTLEAVRKSESIRMKKRERF